MGYILGPRINAGGRVGKGYLGSILLSTNSYQEAYDAAKSLEKYNQQRKSIESIIQCDIIDDTDKQLIESLEKKIDLYYDKLNIPLLIGTKANLLE